MKILYSSILACAFSFTPLVSIADTTNTPLHTWQGVEPKAVDSGRYTVESIVEAGPWSLQRRIYKDTGQVRNVATSFSYNEIFVLGKFMSKAIFSVQQLRGLRIVSLELFGSGKPLCPRAKCSVTIAFDNGYFAKHVAYQRDPQNSSRLQIQSYGRLEKQIKTAKEMFVEVEMLDRGNELFGFFVNRFDVESAIMFED